MTINFSTDAGEKRVTQRRVVIILPTACTREWFSTARNYALYSNQGGVYDDILKYLKM